MINPFQSSKTFSLQVHIVSLFTFLIIISGSTLGWYSYQQLSKNIINSGKTLLDNSSAEVVNKIHSESAHILSMLRIVSASKLSDISTEQEKLASLPVLAEMLKATSSLSALFIAYPNNDFFLYKKIQSKAILDQYNANADSYFMMTLRQSGKTNHLFFGFNGALLNKVEDPDYSMQFTQRPWFNLAKSSDSYAISKAYLFHASQELGLTLSVNDKDNGAVIGADYTLSTLSRLLESFKAYPSSERIVVNNEGNVVAYQDTQALLSEQQKLDELRSIDSLNNPILVHVFKHYKDQKGTVLFSFNGEDWLGKVSSLSANRNLKLFQLVKTTELLSDAYILRDKSVFITLLIILFTLPIAWYFARLLTSPIRVLTNELQKIKNFDFSQGTKNKTSIKEISELTSVTNSMKKTISHFLDLSASLVKKQSSQQLFHKICQECNNAPNSQGSIIIINNKQDCQIKHCQFPLLSIEDNNLLIEKFSSLTFSFEQLVNNHNQQTIPDEILQLINAIMVPKQQFNWRLLAMKNSSGENLGVIAVLELQQAPLSEGTLQYTQAIASFSALAIQSQQLLAEQKQLLESFILLIAGAIDSQSPYTGGHCARVPELTKMLTRAACDDQQGAYKNFNLSEDQWEELHIAAWLHDCGKIVTPEYIVDKATKLETVYDRLNEVRMRFELLKVEADKCFWQGLANNGDKDILSRQRDKLLKKLDEEFEFVAECNIGGEFMSDDKIKQLNEIANRTWTRTLNNKIGIAPHQALKIPETSLPTQENLLSDKIEHLIEREHIELTEPGNKWGFNMETPHYRFNRGELYNLSVKRGTLTDEDRFVINGHMVHTIAMLSKLPFPEHLKNIPTIAGGHHEKMDGTGYPRKIKATELPATARMMVIADIFEALTASDRPYKERKTLSQSIKIMSFMVKDDHIDPEVFELFLTSGVYLHYANEYLLEDQIDEVNIRDYL